MSRPTKAPPGPGDQQPGETGPAFAAFRAYLDLGPARSTAKVARGLGKSTTLIHRWSARWEWVRRVREFEGETVRAKDDATRSAVAEIARKQAAEARLHATATTVVSRELVRRVTSEPDFLRALDATDLVRLAAAMPRAHNRAVITERLALGMTTDQPGEEIPLAQAQEQAARLTDAELDARLAPVDDEVGARRRKRAAA